MIVYPFQIVKSKFHPAKRRKLFFNSKTDAEIREEINRIRQELRGVQPGQGLGLNNKYEDRIGKIQKDLKRCHREISRDIPGFIKAGADVELIIEQLLQGLDIHSKESTQIREEIQNDSELSHLLKFLDEIDTITEEYKKALEELKAKI